RMVRSADAVAYASGSDELRIGDAGARRGAAAVELAVLLPFLAVMFAAALDFCRAFYASQAIESAARVAALYASGTTSNPNASDAATAAKQAAVLECSTLAPPLTEADVSTSTSGGNVVVTVTYDF